MDTRYSCQPKDQVRGKITVIFKSQGVIKPRTLFPRHLLSRAARFLSMTAHCDAVEVGCGVALGLDIH